MIASYVDTQGTLAPLVRAICFSGMFFLPECRPATAAVCGRLYGGLLACRWAAAIRRLTP